MRPLVLQELEARMLLSLFTVTNTGDNGGIAPFPGEGTGTLRQAIVDANADPDPAGSTIDFNIQGEGSGPFTINTFLPLPAIETNHPVLIDGYSQSGASVNTQTTSDDAVLMIDLDGTYSYFPTYGLDIVSGGCTVKGLAITNYSTGIQVDTGTSGALIEGNFIGTDVTGSNALGNSEGILFDGGNSNTVGGTTPDARNIIAGNTSDDVRLTSAFPGSTFGNLIEGNFIGVTASGISTPITEANNGVSISGTDGTTIGGTDAGAGNVIAGHYQNGIQLDASNDTLVQGNFIGTDPTGTNFLGNFGPGVFLLDGSSGDTIGGLAAGAGNTIAFNSGAGVVVGNYPGDLCVGNAILSNSIYQNAALGIDLGDNFITPNTPGGPHSGPNELQNFPVLTTAATFNGRTYVVGTLNSAPNATFTVQFFANSPPDPTGYGQGQSPIGTTTVTTDTNGNASVSTSFPTVVPSGEAISATTTDSGGDTSEFGQNAVVFAASGLVVAAADTYNLFVNTSITVPAPGVLGNDYGLTGNPLTPVLVQSTSHGSLSLQSSGAFSYTPQAGFVGTDTFTYYDTDGTNQSNVATVTINVNPLSLVVTNTNDSGPGSLRQALLVADLSTSATPQTILFKIPGTGPFLIQVLTPLPAITHPTVINGYNQAGAKPNSLAQGENAVILIGLVGSGGGDGLTLSAGGSTVEGLAFDRFQYGIHVTTAGGDVITGNFIGTGPSGTGRTGNNGTGILLDGPGGNRIGGTGPSDRNLISNNDQEGIWIRNGSTGNTVQGNWIGIDATDANRLGNGRGVVLDDSPNNTVGGQASGAGNVISSNFNGGIVVESAAFFGPGSPNTLIQGNFIGTDATGEADLGNFFAGVLLYQGSNCTIGGTSAKARNVISANFEDGISIWSGVSGTVIQGNLIGTDATGSKPLGNRYYGVEVYNGGTVIGGPAPGAGNVISANRYYGIADHYSPSVPATLIQGNYIGTDASGTQPLGNGSDGINVGDVNDTIGGTTAGAGNVISANGGSGISVDYGAGYALVQGNLIGTDKTGTKPLGNTLGGVTAVYFANTIGGTAAGAGNVIAANGGDGIVLGGVYAIANLIQGNFIGTDTTGAKNLGNAGHGVDVQVYGNSIGGTVRGAGNTIAFNGEAGVAVVDNANEVPILSNAIYANHRLGIDLNDDGVTLNHLGGPISGPNNFQNFPVLTGAVGAGGTTTITGSLNGALGTSYLIQFFANASADPTGYGQGQALIGSITVMTDSSGNASFTATFKGAVPAGQFVSAAATDPSGDTSEFSQDVVVTKGGSAPLAVVSVGSRLSIAPLSKESTSMLAPAPVPAGAVVDAAVEALVWDEVLIRPRRRTVLDGNEDRSPLT